MSCGVFGLGIFQHDMIDHVAGVAGAVGDFFKKLEQVAREHDFDGVLFL
jgi:hypothetical protein